MLLIPTRTVSLTTEAQEVECSCHSHICIVQILILVHVSANILANSDHFADY